jgi:hypothetical protein
MVMGGGVYQGSTASGSLVFSLSTLSGPSLFFRLLSIALSGPLWVAVLRRRSVVCGAVAGVVELMPPVRDFLGHCVSCEPP